MSYSWRLSRGSSTFSDKDAPHGQGEAGTASQSTAQPLGSAAVEKPLTPPSVRNITPSICLSIIQFRALLQEYRSLDDSVTTRLNRTMANSRAQGLTLSPSILSGHVPSVSSTDLGKSTYATAPEQACLGFWKELVNVWIGREEVLEYCLKVERRESRARGHESETTASSLSGAGRSQNGPAGQSGLNDEEWLLNSDIGRREREARLSNSNNTSPAPASKARYDAFDSRASRSEDSSDALRRHLNNELAIEAILRKRSLDVYKSRCRFFTPHFAQGKRGEQERAMWEGSDTSAGQQARTTSASL